MSVHLLITRFTLMKSAESGFSGQNEANRIVFRRKSDYFQICGQLFQKLHSVVQKAFKGPGGLTHLRRTERKTLELAPKCFHFIRQQLRGIRSEIQSAVCGENRPKCQTFLQSSVLLLQHPARLVIIATQHSVLNNLPQSCSDLRFYSLSDYIVHDF